MKEVFVDANLAPPYLILHHWRSKEGIVIKPARQTAGFNPTKEISERPE
jgi:hypothetical protein